jgi:hypothetical protein
LQRLADPFPGTPRHNPGTLNLSWSQMWHSTFELRCFTWDKIIDLYLH